MEFLKGVLKLRNAMLYGEGETVDEKIRLYSRYPLPPALEMVSNIAALANPLELRNWFKRLSSLNHGAWVFHQAFPPSQNPDKFSSTPFQTNLTDTPFQALGWKEVDTLKDQGIEDGLDKLWIDLGFEMQVVERGIDLEWHFHQTPPQRRV